MKGPARAEWEHSIPPLAEHRYSITLRSLLSGAQLIADDVGNTVWRVTSATP
ncbi:hypothetical protein [Mesorhizobium metallidurans]|uniref:hypothetical protein n=1 Tax=Mesorhizobium metallidurans TaxID=489722 RepID=UPI0003480B52|nr:hypothetical protein [Mesorhizobium metallidurans]